MSLAGPFLRMTRCEIQGHFSWSRPASALEFAGPGGILNIEPPRFRRPHTIREVLPMRLRLSLAALALSASLLPAAARAQWAVNGDSLCTAAQTQQNVAIT